MKKLQDVSMEFCEAIYLNGMKLVKEVNTEINDLVTKQLSSSFAIEK